MGEFAEEWAGDVLPQDNLEGNLEDVLVDDSVVQPHDAAVEQWERDEVMRMLDALPKDERDCIALRVGLDGHRPHTKEEIARELGLSAEEALRLETRALAALLRCRPKPIARSLRDMLHDVESFVDSGAVV